MSIRRSDTRQVARSNSTRKPKKGLDDVQQGIKTLYPPNESNIIPEVDIVFVPGLGADPINSWKSNTTDFNWTSDKDGIVRDFPKSRILLYQYESAWIGPLKVKQYLGNLGSTLLHGLRSKRDKCARRPIVFIGHSMGGLVIAKAITLADSRRDLFPAMFETIAGCIFFGTPFGGALAAAAASFFALVGEKFDKTNSSKLVDLMKPGDESLRELKNDFVRLVGKLSQKIELFCFWEEQPTNFAKLIGLPSWVKVPKEIAEFVTRESATLTGINDMGLASIHRDLVKFDGPKDERYQLVRNPLKTIIHGAQLVVKNRLNSTRNINHETITEVMEVLEGAQIQKKRKALGAKYAASSWLTKEQEYRDWLTIVTRDNDLDDDIVSPTPPVEGTAKCIDCLWIQGPEGRGKTNNTVAAIEEIEKMIMADAESSSGQAPTLLAYFFCEPTSDYCTAEDLLKSFLWQLVKQQGLLAPYAKHFVKKKGKDEASKSTPQITVENMWQVLQDMLSDEFIGNRVYFIINNLHVLPEEGDSTSKFMKLINSELLNMNLQNQKRVPVRWLITSRDKFIVREALSVPGIRLIDLEDQKYEGQVQLELRKHAYLKVRALSDEKKYNKAAAYFASSLIGRRAQNTQWIDIACIQLKEIPENENELTIRQILENMPQDLALLLERAWLQIFRQNIKDVEKIHEMLRALVLTFEDPTEAELGVLTGLYFKEESKKDELKKDDEKKVEEKSKLRLLVEQCKPLLVVKRTPQSEVKICFMNVVVKSHLLQNAEKLLGLSKEAMTWQHGVLSLRSFSHLMETLNYAEPEPVVAKEGDDEGNAANGDENSSQVEENEKSNEDEEEEDEEEEENKEEEDEEEEDDDDIEGFSEEDSDWDNDDSDHEMDPESEKVKDAALAYAVKHWLHHASKATVEISEDLSLEEEFWKEKALIRRRWLIEYARLTTAFDDIELDRNLSALHVAASVGFAQLVVALIKHGHQEELNLRDEFNSTPLHLAAYFGRVNIVEELLNKGAIIDDGKEEGYDTPLHNAALQGNAPIMRKLIHRGADINAYSPDDVGTVVNAAICSGNRDAIELLIEKGASLTTFTSENEESDGPLALAAQLSDLSMFEYLINACADKLPPEEYDKALVAAADAGRVEVFTKLLSYNHPQECFQEALEAATLEDNWEIIMILLDRCQTDLECTALFEEASGTTEDQDKVLRAIWKHQNGVVMSETLEKALICATGCGKHSTVELLLDEFHANPNAADEDSGTALTEAAYSGDLDLVKLLLDKDADVNSPDGWALQTAAAEGHESIVQELLLRRNANVNACTTNENFPAGTALQAACEAGRLDMVKLLLENKANPNIGTGPHGCPLIAAAERGEDEIVKLLVDANADVNVMGGSDSSTPLIKAAAYLPKESLELLLKAGADINLTDGDGDTALIVAAARGDEDCVQFLLDEGADIMHSNNEGLNAIQTAVDNMSESCLPPLVNRASKILSAIKTAIESGNSAVKDVIQSVKFEKEEQRGEDERRKSFASFEANDDKIEVLRSSINKAEDPENEENNLEETIETGEDMSPNLDSLFDQEDKQLENASANASLDDGQPPESDELGVESLFQEPKLSFTPPIQSLSQNSSSIPTQMGIRRKPPASSTLGQQPPATLPSQEPAPIPPLQSAAIYSSQSDPTPQYQPSNVSYPTPPWSPEQGVYQTPPPPQHQYFSSTPEQPIYTSYNQGSQGEAQVPSPLRPTQSPSLGDYFAGTPFLGDRFSSDTADSGTRQVQ